MQTSKQLIKIDPFDYYRSSFVKYLFSRFPVLKLNFQTKAMSRKLISNLQYRLMALSVISVFQDILENEDVKLDNMFIASLVGDILRVRI